MLISPVGNFHFHIYFLIQFLWGLLKDFQSKYILGLRNALITNHKLLPGFMTGLYLILCYVFWRAIFYVIYISLCSFVLFLNRPYKVIFFVLRPFLMKISKGEKYFFSAYCSKKNDEGAVYVAYCQRKNMMFFFYYLNQYSFIMSYEALPEMWNMAWKPTFSLVGQFHNNIDRTQTFFSYCIDLS